MNDAPKPNDGPEPLSPPEHEKALELAEARRVERERSSSPGPTSQLPQVQSDNF